VLIDGRCGIGNDAAPQVLAFKGLHVVSCYDAEVAGSAFESSEEVGIGVFVGVRDETVSEDNLEIDDVVTGQSKTRSVVGYSTTDEEATNTNGGTTSASDHTTQRLKGLIYITPSSTWLNACYLGFGIVRGAVHVLQIDGHPVLNIVGSRDRSVAAGSYSKLARLQQARSCENFHGCGYIIRRVRLHDTVWRQLALDIEIRVNTSIV
jgi:hypothetical protein